MNPTLFPGYLFDTNTIIELGRRMSPRELRASANTIVDSLIEQRLVFAPLEVYKEIQNGAKDKGNEVLVWCNQRKHIFIELSEAQQEHLATVLAQFPSAVKYDSPGYDADPILIALAMDMPGWTVVTRDGFNSNGKIGVKQLCDHFGLSCITEFDMLKANGWQV